MEILHKFKQNGYFTAEIYHLLANKKLVEPLEEITPSSYVREMLMNTSERLKNLNNVEVDNIVHSGNKSNNAVLSFTPRIIVFQNFKPNEKIVTKFSIKNISKAPIFLNMVFKESLHFFIKPCGGQLLSRLAPGISVTFAVTFIPVQYEDYTHRVTFYTDVDQYVLPLIAMGPRPVFDFPDQISIPKVPLKIENCIYMVIHNVGTIAAGFTLNTKCPFSVNPKSAYLSPGQKIDIRIGFKTMNLGNIQGYLYAMLETGEKFQINLSGITHTVSVELEKEVIRFLDTYNTMVRQQTVKIVNKSNHVLSYLCMKNESVYYDFEDKMKIAKMFNDVKDNESTKSMKLVYYDVLSSEEHETVYTRIFIDEIQALVADESLSFQNTHFSITPIKGKLWPNQTTEITLTFSPKQIGEFESIAYLDIDGVVERVPLHMVGSSLPPAIHLNLETLDMGCIYINNEYNYEVVAHNKGHINGVIIYKGVPPLFGSQIKCTPELHCLRPGEKETFVISFSNSNQGPFFEEINFLIRDTDVVLILYLKGEVIYPSLMFSVPCLDFGMVSLGVPKTLSFEVINEAVHVSGSLKISSDGSEISSITLADYAVAEKPKPVIPQRPKEFNIDPCKIDIQPQSRISLNVTLIANLIRANKTFLELELEKSDSPPIILPILYNAMVPEITPAREIKLRACCLNYPYKYEIFFTVNEFWGYFTLEELQEDSTLEVEVNVKEGRIEPNTEICLPVTIKTSVLGVQEHWIRIWLFGMTKSIEVCHITACGVQPIVTCTPLALHWGHVKLLNKSQKILKLCNESPVQVNFKASLLNKDERWHLEPTEGFVEPESEANLLVTLYLVDADTYTNKAVIQLENVKDILVQLSATGVGTSILVGDLCEGIFLGRHFTNVPLNIKVVMENSGTRMHALEWSEHYKTPKTKQQTTAFFDLDPKVFKMTAGEKIELTISGLSHKATTIKELWYLVGSVEGVNKKELLLECQIVAEFVDPKIEVSSSLIDLQYDYGPYNESYKLTDVVTIKNVSKLPLDLDISVKPPFAIIHKKNTYKISPEEENLCCCICYSECDLNITKMYSEIGSYQSRIFIDYLTLKPVELTRKKPLNFFQNINEMKLVFNLTHTIKEHLEDLEVMKIQILFDTTKHSSLKSKVYYDFMRIMFSGHNNKDAIKLIGKINFPNIFISSPKVDFQCILNGSLESKSIKLENKTPLLVCFRFQWKKCFIAMTSTPDITKIVYTKNIDNVKSSKDGLVQNNYILDKATKDEGFDRLFLTPESDSFGIESILLEASEKELNMKKKIFIKKISPMIDFDYEAKFDWVCKFGKDYVRNKFDINDVLQITPHRGLLKPNEIQYVNVTFKPKPNINVRAILECEVLGGPSESIIVQGQSSNLIYKINTQKINFNIRSFHELASEKLTISNLAQLPFEYKTYLKEPIIEDDFQGTIKELVPPENVLEAEEQTELKIVIRPGVLGYFNRTFLLEIGHLSHIPIEVFGWGVIPQIYMFLQRPEITKLNSEYGYLAITALSTDYLSAVSEFFHKDTFEHHNSPQIDKCSEDPDLRDWHICSFGDGYPSIMDIELAIERMLVIDYIKLKPEILTGHSTSIKMSSIFGFQTTPYVLDYGVVITGSTVKHSSEIVNYGPIAIKLQLAKGTRIPAWLCVKMCGKLNPGEIGKLEVVFSPTSTQFTELEQRVETCFYLQVPYGVTIPVKVKALCAVPYLLSNVSTVNFGSVKCGDKVICSIPLKNKSKTTCIWYATLRLKSPGTKSMTVLDSSGRYEPGEGGWLSIAFKPTMELVYEGLLIFRFHMNPNRMTILVTGRGIVPHVHVIGPNVNFPPALPWAETTEFYFGLTNPCPFPIELVIAHSDEKWKEEDEIYQLLYKYYNKPEEILVPAISAGAELPKEIMHFYKTFTESVKNAIGEESVAMKTINARSIVATKKSKSLKNASKSTSPSQQFRTEEEIRADQIKMMKENQMDPLKDCLHVFDHISADSGSDKYSKGLLIIVHGSPCEESQCQEVAYSIGKSLVIPVINIDLCIVEALCVSTCPAKGILMSAINEMYQMSRKPVNKTDSGEIEENTEEIFGDTEDEFDIILKKIKYLASNKNVITPRSKASDKKKKKSSTLSINSHNASGGIGFSTLFQMELIQELLTDFFHSIRFNRGFIVDTLTSIVIKNPCLTLTTILKCKQNIWNIHLILCQSDFHKWAQAYEENVRKNDIVSENIDKIYDEIEIEQIVKSFEEMDDEEYENSSPELKSLYLSHGLQRRRKRYHDKKGYPSETLKKDKAKDRSKLLQTVDTSESKKKIKKDDVKGKPTSEYLNMNTKYNEYYKNTYDSLINIANNWIVEECDLGFPMCWFNGQVVGSAKKTKKKSEVNIQISDVNFFARGFPLTIVTCPCQNYKIALVNMLLNSPVVREALKDEKEFDVLKCPVNRKEFTVLLPKIFPHIQHEDSLKWHYLDELPIKKCECNQFTELYLLDDSTQDNVLKILSKWNCGCDKKVTSSQTSTSSLEKNIGEHNVIEENYTLPLHSAKSLSAISRRLVLQPGELVRCKFSYSPQAEGNFSVKRFVEVSGWPESRTDINVTGVCDLPRLDSRPKKMFNNFIRRTKENKIYKLTYLDDQKLFEFGAIFIGYNRIYEEKYTIDLKNSSLLSAEVEIEFLEGTNTFHVDKSFINLEPGDRGKLNISAAPTQVGVHNSVLLFCVKDNPELITINIACSGVSPVVEILPLTKIIEYGKLLLYRREDDRFIIKNDSILPIMWKIRNAEDFHEDFIISQTSGIVPTHDNQVVPVTYVASRVGIIQNKMLYIDIYDAEGRGDPMMMETISFSAECYDVMVECAYEDPNETFLNYGNVKVNSTVTRKMYLLNRGKYDIYYKLKKMKSFPEKTLLRSFEVTSECGIVPANLKLVTIEFHCTPTTSMNLTNVPVYACSLLDGGKEQVVVAKFSICVTIASFYNTFTLFPLQELNFHVIPVETTVTKEVTLNNTSKCPMTFEIVLPPEYQLDTSFEERMKHNKIKTSSTRCGNFLIMNDDNFLAAGTSRTIQIQFMATAAKKFEETINFVVNDTCPAEAQGVPLKLVGIGAMPTLDIWNLENTFREHLIVKSLSEYKIPEYSSHCVFVEDSVTLHFFCVNVNTSHIAAIDLYNNGLVACALTMKLHYQSNTDKSHFYLDKYEAYIEPLLHKTLEVIFSPKALQEYRAVLEIKLKLTQNQERTFKICLIGEGVIPRICMISPSIRQQRMSLLQFPVTCLGSISNKNLRFKNISPVKCVVKAEITQSHFETRPVFWLASVSDCEQIALGNYDTYNTSMKVNINPEETVTIGVQFNPIKKGKTSCDIYLTIMENPYEFFSVLCEAEAFIEDIVLIGLEMLSMDVDLDTYRISADGSSTVSTIDSRKKIKSAPLDKNKSRTITKAKKSKNTSVVSMKFSDTSIIEPSLLKYILDFGGCELGLIHKRNIIMTNNSNKVYKFVWQEVQCICIKPSLGYISPGEEKDIEIIFFSIQPIVIQKESLTCLLTAVNDDTLMFDMKGASWDNRQTITLFNHNREVIVNERCEIITGEPTIPYTESRCETIQIIIIYSAVTEHTKYTCTLKEEITLRDTFIYQISDFDFKVENVGKVPMKIVWSFQIDDEFPVRIDKFALKNTKIPDSEVNVEENISENDIIRSDQYTQEVREDNAPSKITLFSGSKERESVDTWFEMDLPFSIEPAKDCIRPYESRIFKVTFSPLDAFDYKVRLQSSIENLDPYDLNACSKISAKSLVPYCHLDIPVSDYLTSGRRKMTEVALPNDVKVLEFNVLGSGCYKKSFRVINPTSEAYEFIFEMVMSDKLELVPVHCDTLKGYVEGGTATNVTFTFSPTGSGVYESQWKFLIPIYNLVINLLVVGQVRAPDVAFVPTILIVKNSLVGYTTTHTIKLRNNESETLKFEFKGNSLCNEFGKTPVVLNPEEGVLRPHSDTIIKINYTPIADGPLSFKIFCSITHMTKFLTLCVNTLSYSIKPKITYYIIGNEHILSSDAITNIHLDQTASTYERIIPFTIKNDGSATFFFDWYYNISSVKKYLQVSVEPKKGHVAPATNVECVLTFKLKQVPVQAFPVTLTIIDGPVYNIYLYAEIKKPLYHFSCMYYDFGKCIVNAPESTYKKNLAFFNDDGIPVILDLNFSNLPELFIDYRLPLEVQPGARVKIPIFFRPKQVREYDIKLQFWINSLCEETVTIKGEGVALLFDLYEGCQKSFDLGPVKVGEKIVRQIEVMNHSKVPIDASFIFRDIYPTLEDTDSEVTSVCLSPSVENIHSADTETSRVHMLQCYKDNEIREQIALDTQHALSSLKVIPTKCTIRPYTKVPIRIQFKPVGIISTLNVQLNMKVFEFERPLVALSGKATGMSLCLNQTSLQFGRVRKRGCKVLKVMLLNKGDFGTRFWWQPLKSDELVISPMQGTIAANTNVTFTVTFRPMNYNPFIKVWASCNIENYVPLELAMYATCVATENVQSKSLYLECPVRETHTEYVVVTNATDNMWSVLSEVSGGPFETLGEFNVEPNSTFNVPIHFKPKSMGKHEGQVLFSPLGESALLVTLTAVALDPNPTGNITLNVSAKEYHTEELLVYNITEFPENYIVSTEIVKTIPDKFDGYYEIRHPDKIKVWGEAAATCRWTFVCYSICEMHIKVLFVNEKSREYQYYNIVATVTASDIVDTLTFESRARELIQKDIKVTNPLAQDADFYIRCDKLNCPNVINISRHSEAIVVLTYAPLVVGEFQDHLEVNNQIVGSYIYKVVLKCLPAKEKNLEYSTPLGTSIPLRLRVQNNTDVKANFTCTASHTSVQTEKEYTLGPHEKGKFLVWFEPTELGIQNCRLSFNSVAAGEFVFNIKGEGSIPKPQGPYEIKAGGCTMIKFKNVFDENRTFKIYVDRQEFYVKTLHELIKGKKDIKIAVYLREKPVQGWTEMPTGCLTIECSEPADPKVHWTYFLQGIP